jgi:hypothetical protein
MFTFEVVNFPDALRVGTFGVGELLTDGDGEPEADGVAGTVGVAELGAGSGAMVLVGWPARVTGATMAFTQITMASTPTAPRAMTAHNRGPILRAPSLTLRKAPDRAARTSRGLVCWLTPPP